LFLGTHKENIEDATAKGRMKGLKGELNTNSKLTEENVLEIRAMNSKGASRTAIAKQFDVSVTLISGIVSGRSWKHLLPKSEQLTMF